MEERSGSDFRKGLWTVEEDNILMDYIKLHGKGKWNRVAKITGLKRCGKSCRLRWMNYLSPNVKRGEFSQEEDDLIIRLHNLLGNRWSLIAGRIPGRTDNQVKNHWNTHLSKKLGVKRDHTKPKSLFKHSLNEKKIRFDSNSIPSPTSIGSEEATDKATERVVDVTGAAAGEQRTYIESNSESSSFWFFSEDFLNFHTTTSPSSNFNELVYDKYLEFGWEGL